MLDIDGNKKIEQNLFENSNDGSNYSMADMHMSMKLKPNDLTFKDHEEGIRSQFMPYREIIEGLTNMYVKETNFDIVNCMFSNDTTRILTILKENDEHYVVC